MFPFAALLTLALAGCVAAAPPAAAPAPAAAPSAAAAVPAASLAPSAAATVDPARRPLGPPTADRAAFGAIEAAWTVPGEAVAIYGTREQPFAGKRAGTTTSYYVYVGGRVYGIHWDDLEKFKALKLGETANLHPGDMVVCKDDPTHPEGNRCWRLYHVYPGKRAIAPLGG